MLWQLFQLILGEARNVVHIAVLVSHEVEILYRKSDRLGADSKEAADVDNDGGDWAGAMKMRDTPDFSSPRP
ncbi:hypothetical protein EV667_4272 [Ancylobacter aquaticus]|uniref:Uncharacterized protein n=1 Tax=Ancylobacter aquaticus TaxID=100 RepID=A0A4R1HE11_ANCAQ|nr:hypothetical protein EV667_4272 [Ancylobacter aquaticus]